MSSPRRPMMKFSMSPPTSGILTSTVVLKRSCDPGRQRSQQDLAVRADRCPRHGDFDCAASLFGVDPTPSLGPRHREVAAGQLGDRRRQPIGEQSDRELHSHRPIRLDGQAGSVAVPLSKAASRARQYSSSANADKMSPTPTGASTDRSNRRAMPRTPAKESADADPGRASPGFQQCRGPAGAAPQLRRW